MNTENYASLEASRRLVEAGIVLLYVEKAWIHDKWKDTWELGVVTPTIEARSERWEFYSAPSMAEVWMGLREAIPYDGETYLQWWLCKQGDLTKAVIPHHRLEFVSINPTDALIDLLIWVRKEAE